MKFLVSALWRIVALGLITAAVLLIVNFNFAKPQIEARFTALLGQPVHIGGDVRLGQLGWHPALALHAVEVGADLKADKVVVNVQNFDPSRGVLVRADGLKFRDRLLGDYDIPVIAGPTGFEISPLRGGMKGASFNGKIKYMDGKLNIEGTLKKLPLVLLADEAEGEIEGNIMLEGKGDTSEQLMHSLNGRLMLTSGSGKLTSGSLNFWSRGLIGSLLPGRKEATLNCAILDFNIENGAANSRAIIIDTSDNTVFAKGSVDLASGKVDMILRPNPKKMELVSLATPVHVTGSLDNATVAPEAGAVVKKLGGTLLGVVNPAFALIPLLTTGFDDYKGSCAVILKEKAQQK